MGSAMGDRLEEEWGEDEWVEWTAWRRLVARVAVVFVMAHSFCLDVTAKTPVGSARSWAMLRLTNGLRRAALAMLRGMS